MVDKFEGLISRLETSVGKLEQTHKDKLESLVVRLENSISKLERIQGGETEKLKSEEKETGPKETSTTTTTPSKGSDVEAFTAFNDLYKEWEEKAKAVGNPDLIELVCFSSSKTYLI